MNKFVACLSAHLLLAKAQEKLMCKEWQKEADKNYEKYWDACNYPRKTKKRMRKEARIDYYLYTRLAEPIL